MDSRKSLREFLQYILHRYPVRQDIRRSCFLKQRDCRVHRNAFTYSWVSNKDGEQVREELPLFDDSGDVSDPDVAFKSSGDTGSSGPEVVLGRAIGCRGKETDVFVEPGVLEFPSRKLLLVCLQLPILLQIRQNL